MAPIINNLLNTNIKFSVEWLIFKQKNKAHLCNGKSNFLVIDISKSAVNVKFMDQQSFFKLIVSI